MKEKGVIAVRLYHFYTGYKHIPFKLQFLLVIEGPTPQFTYLPKPEILEGKSLCFSLYQIFLCQQRALTLLHWLWGEEGFFCEKPRLWWTLFQSPSVPQAYLNRFFTFFVSISSVCMRLSPSCYPRTIKIAVGYGRCYSNGDHLIALHHP